VPQLAKCLGGLLGGPRGQGKRNQALLQQADMCSSTNGAAALLRELLVVVCWSLLLLSDHTSAGQKARM